MKKSILYLALMLMSISVMSQNWIYIHGTVTDSLSGNPVPQHEVTIFSDSVNGVYYYNAVLTDSSGYYNDAVPVLASSGTIYVRTVDCHNLPHYGAIQFDPANDTYTWDFQICTEVLLCDAYFYYNQVANLTLHFIDLSQGNPTAWYWSFGDQSTSTEQHPTHTYASGGTYTVYFNMSNDSTGCNDSFSRTINVVDSNYLPCEAQFYYYPYPQGSPDSFHFIDMSTGTVTTWNWSFGDGTYSTEQFPFHTYPGPGTYDACLVISGPNCSDTSCQTIAISDTVYQQVYGQVFAGNFPLQQGYVQLYVTDPVTGYTPFGEAEQVDSNGIYYFTLVPAGTYLIQTVPYDSITYLPTYYGDVINWEQATPVTIGTPENPYNINLVPSGQMTYGPGSASGNISIGRPDRAPVDKIIMLLMNENRETIGFARVNSYGYFSFPSLDYGIYYIRAELSGVSSDNMFFEITEQVPHVEIILKYSDNAIWGTDEPGPGGAAVSVYPNPVSEKLYISLNLSKRTIIEIGLYATTGQIVYCNDEPVNEGSMTLTIPTEGLPAGLYTLRVSTGMGLNLVKKIIKMQ